MYDDVVAVHAVSWRRSGADEALLAGIIRQSHCAAWQFAAISGIRRQFGDTGGQVGDGPVPEARCRRRIGVVHGHGEALGLLGEPRPAQLWGDVFTARTHDAADLV